jgi:carboxypeptidase D
MNLHGGAVCVNIPWDSKPNTDGQHFGDDQLMFSLANDYTSHNAPMHAVNEDSFHNGVTYGYEWYQVLGGMQDWADFFQQSTHATLELSDVKWPDAGDLPGFWSDNRESLIGYLQSGMTGFHLKAVDAKGKAVPIDVDMSTATRTLHFDNGVVHRPAVGGSQQVTLKASGFQTQTLTLSPVLFDGTYQTVVMKP